MRAKPKDGGWTTSLWHDTRLPTFDTRPELETDVCVVGAGIAGLTVAFELVRQGVRVSVIDDGPIGGGETGRTTAHLASAVDDRLYRLEERLGARGARQVAESHAAAIDWIEMAVHELAIDCDFERVDGYLFAPGDTSRELDKELVAARRAGLAVERVDRAPLAIDTGPALRFARQAQFHPLRYLRGLAEAIVERGGHIHTHAHVAAIKPGEPLTVELEGDRRMLCRIAIDATNATITSPIKLTIRQAAYRSYVIAFDLAPGSVPRALYWDTEHPYHYARVANGTFGRDVLVVGGGDHRTGRGDAARAWGDVERWGRSMFPIAGSVITRWSGQVLEPADGPAFIGKSPDLDHVYVVSGDSGNGLTHGTIAGMLLPELLRGRGSPWAAIYDPSRTHLHGFGTFVKQAAGSAVPYAEWLGRGDVATVDDIPCGEGAVVRRGLHMLAAFRDEAGVCHVSSATCPHMRGVVHWNAAEQSWDCPCHGSRFDAYGRVVNGPATKDLAAIDEPIHPPAVREPVAALPLDPESVRRRH